MRKINLENYRVKAKVREEDKVVEKDLDYDVKDTIISVLFHPDLKLNGRELILRGKLADKIEKAEKNILLEEADYKKLKDSVEKLQGFGRNELELVDRILNAPSVEVEPKDKKGGEH